MAKYIRNQCGKKIILDISTDMDWVVREEQNDTTSFHGNKNYTYRGLNSKTLFQK